MNTPSHCFLSSALLFATLAGSAPADTLEPAWAVLPEEAADPGYPFHTYPWFTSTHSSVRGVASNPTNGNVLVLAGAAFTPPPDTERAIWVLDSEGNALHSLSLDGLPSAPGGGFPLDMIGVADDGVVYAGALDTRAAGNNTARNFHLMRWENDSDPLVADDPIYPTLAFQGDPAGLNEETGESLNGQRWGDSLDVKGAGADTKIVIGARGSGAICIFDTEDGAEFTPHLINGAGPSGGILGIAFGPDITGYDDPSTTEVEDLTLLTVFSKINNDAVLRRAAIRTDTWQLVSLALYNGSAGNPPTLPGATTTSLGSHPATGRLGGLEFLAAADQVNLLTWSSITAETSSGALVLEDIEVLPADFANANATGAIDFFVAGEGQTPGQNGIPPRDRLYVVDSNNAIVAYNIIPPTTDIPPSFTLQPQGYPAATPIIAGWKAAFSATASGTPTPTYQWQRDGVDIPGATEAGYLLDPVAEADSGATFTVVASNAAGNVTSDPAVLTVVPRVDTEVMTGGWKLAPGARPYLDSGELQRGLAYNAAFNQLVLVSRTAVTGLPNPAVVVLNAADGSEVQDEGQTRALRLTTLDGETVVSGGLFLLNTIGCGGDGAVFATNLVVNDGGAAFRVYRWQDTSPESEPTIVFEGDLFGNLRCGDFIGVRGSGNSTQILVGARDAQQFAILTTDDGGATFIPTVFNLSEAENVVPTQFFISAFGQGNTIWTKEQGGSLKRLEFDLGAATAAVTHTFPAAQFASGVSPIAIDPVTGLLAGVNVRETPDNLRLYDVSDLEAGPALLDLEFFATDNTNVNATGAVAFGNGFVYALDTNNGLVAQQVNFGPPPVAEPAVLTNLTYTGTTFSFLLNGVSGQTYQVETSTTLLEDSWTDGPEVTLAGASQLVELTVPEGAPAVYYRVVTVTP